MFPIIVSQKLLMQQGTNEIQEVLDIKWGRFLKECGLFSVPIPVNANTNDFFNYIKPKGILLTGGNDIYCVSKGDSLSKTRDQFENGLIKIGLEQKIPIVGVCRGMQIIANYFHAHLKKCLDHVNTMHQISIAQNSMMYQIYGNSTIVNSYHNFCINGINENFIVAANCFGDEKTIEAIECKNSKIIGIMWHPERMEPFVEQDINLFHKFIFNNL